MKKIREKKTKEQKEKRDIQKSIKNEFPKRVMVVFALTAFIFGLLPVRIFVINNDGYNSAADTVNRRTITLSQSRGIIYDRNMNRLVADSYSSISAIKPSEKSLAALKSSLSAQQFGVISQQLSSGEPAAINTGVAFDCEDIMTLQIYNRYNSSRLASHIIGYTDESGTQGVCGIEKSYNDALAGFSGTLKAGFAVDATGRVLSGKDIEVINENYNSGGGVVLTLDKRYQSAVEQAMDSCSLRKGAAVMVEVNTGAIVAMVSRPNYDTANVARYLNDDNSPLFNRALGSYPVGSVFKPLVAAAALEQGYNPAKIFNCIGSTESGGVKFGCLKKHGSVSLAGALAYSCNCYFIELMNSIELPQVLETAATLGFGSPLKLAEGITAYSGNLPQAAAFDSAAARANLSFGQGSLTATPLQIASLYAAIAAGGDYHPPYLVESIRAQNGDLTPVHAEKPPYKVFSKKTASLLNTFLELAVREGTCKAATVSGIKVCGKTATAQSGEYVGGKERLVSWFAGFYPSEKPEYALVVMCEDGTSGSENCAPVFAKAVAMITNAE